MTQDVQTPGGNEPTQIPPGSTGEPTPEQGNSDDDIRLSSEEKEEYEAFKQVKKETGFAKFSQSAREAQRLAKENEELRSKQDEDARLEEELRKTYDWDNMSDTEKRAVLNQRKLEKRVLSLEAEKKWGKDYAALALDIRKKIRARGGRSAFYSFCLLPENVGQKNILNLAKAFIFDTAIADKPQEPSPAPSRMSLEPVGSSQIDTPPVEKKGYTTAEAKKLRVTNPREYNRLVAAGKMNIID